MSGIVMTEAGTVHQSKSRGVEMGVIEIFEATPSRSPENAPFRKYLLISSEFS